MPKILIIDDHPMMHRELEKILTSQGYQFIGAFDVISGLRKAKQERPNLILLDVMLPEMDGLQVVRSIKTDPEIKDIPVIFMSVKFGVKHQQKETTVTVDDVVYPAFGKPLQYAQLLGFIKELINKK